MSASTAIRLSDVTYRWPGDEQDIIDLPTLEIRRGERVFVHGPSGCGKSTLLGLLGGVHRSKSGRIEVLDRDLSKASARERDRVRADHIGIIFQLFNLVPYLSMVANVLLPCRFSRARRARIAASGTTDRDEAERLLSALELTESVLRARAVTSLSIGQQQRVAAARAFIGAPEIVIADEPTSALDEGARGRFLELVLSECERENTTLVLVSHDARLGAPFDRHIDFRALNRGAS